MTPYTLDQLSNPGVKKEEDMFELAGVLVHTGTAETGHYYSYMRLPYDDTQGRPAWAEFNDTEVTSFDFGRMSDSCFGGYWTDAETHLQFPRSWNAYMLFYQRATTAERARRASSATSSSVGIRPDIPANITTTIVDENEMLIRRYCLYDPVHAHFTKGLVSGLKNFDSGVCSGDHRLEEQVYTMALEYAVDVAARIKGGTEFEALIAQILKQVASCGVCTLSTLQWLVEPAQQRLMCDMLTLCPQAKSRQAWVGLVYTLLKNSREHDPDAYGIDIDEAALSEPPIANTGVLDRMVDMLNSIWPRLAYSFRGWDDYFQLLASIAGLGRQEIKVLLAFGIWRGCLDLFNLEGDKYLPSQKRNTDIKTALQRSKTSPSYNMLTKLICHFVINLDVHGAPVDEWSDQIAAYDHDKCQYPLVQEEQDYLTAWAPSTKRLIFLSKLIINADHSDAQSRSWWPGDVIAGLVTKAPALFVEHVVTTLKTMMDLYYPSAGGFVLQAAIGFCKACKNLEDGNEVINAAAINASIIHKYVELRRGSIGGLPEPDPQGGGPHLEFFTLCGEMTKIACSSDKEAMEQPYLLTVIGCASSWAIPTLMFDEFATKEKVCDYLDELIFNQYPIEINVTDYDAAIFDSQRCVAVRALWQEAITHLKIARAKGVPSTWAKHILRMMRECSKWADKLLNEQGSEYGDLQEPKDENMVRGFDQVAKYVADWAESDDYGLDGGKS
jgi:ubiquitin carboxyl-terminal hydrolase 34